MLQLQRAIEDLREYLPLLLEAQKKSIEEYHSEYNDQQKFIHTSTTRACIINDHMKNNLSLVPDLKITKKNRMFLCIIQADSNIYVIRFKKMDRQGKSGNLPTIQASLFKSQEPILDFHNSYNLELGYIFSDFGELEDIILALPNGNNSPFWTYSLMFNIDTTMNDDMFEQHNAEPEHVSRFKQKPKDTRVLKNENQ